MVLKIIFLICVVIFFFALGVFESFVISHLRKIKAKTDNLPNSNHHWNMDVYMNDIPQTEQNTSCLSSVPLRLYERGSQFNFPVPRAGEEILGVYYSGENSFEMTGIVEKVCYDTTMDRIIVECKCTDIYKI